MRDVVFLLDAAFYSQEARGFGDDFELLEDLFPDHEIDEAGLVFEGHEGHAARRGGALAADRDAGVANSRSVGERRDCPRIGDAHRAERFAQRRQGVSSCRVNWCQSPSYSSHSL